MKYPQIKDIIRTLRRNVTAAEKTLWERIRNRQLLGFKFLRQHPIFYDRDFSNLRFFVADFYCAKANLVIELDGKIHDFQKDYDQWRDEIIKSKGIKVLRIRNEELKDIERVLNKIIEALQ